MFMATNLALDDSLVKAAVEIGHHKTKRAAVTAALLEYVQHHKQRRIIDLFGQIDYDPNYDYKKERDKAE